MTKTQAQAFVVLNTHHLRHTGRPLAKEFHLALNDELRELNVALAAWHADDLDVLSDALTTLGHRSLTKELAVRRCLLAIEVKTGLAFPRPVVLAVGNLIGATSEKKPRRRAHG